MTRLLWVLPLLVGCLARAQEAPTPAMLMADDTRQARITLSWPTQTGRTITLTGERAWRSPADKSLLGRNVECYAALGGYRLEKGAGHPKGATVRVGLSKLDPAKLFFEDIAEGATVTLTLDHIVMNQPAVPRPRTGLMQTKYLMNDLDACSLDGTNRSLLNTVDGKDPLQELIVPGTARLGGLDGTPGHGSVETRVETDGSVTITFKFPYVLLRHIRDPYQRTAPGGFFEPTVINFEMELLPKPAADAEKPDKAAEPEKPTAAGKDEQAGH